MSRNMMSWPASRRGLLTHVHRPSSTRTPGLMLGARSVRPRQAKYVKRAALAGKARQLLASARGGSGGGNPKYQILREAQGRQGRQLRRILERLTGSQQASRAGGEVACVNEHAYE